jgi:alkanesulfonate monooxygenase
MEISWFSALCDDDYEYLGVSDPALLSSWEHCRDIALAAEAGGYDNLLLPSGYTLGIDPVSFAAGIAPLLRRCSSCWPCGWARCGRRSWPASWPRPTRSCRAG